MINTLGRSRVDELFYMLEAKTAIAETKYVTEAIYPSVEKVLSTPDGDRKFRMIVKQFIERNSDKLHTSGPVYMIAYMDSDKKQLYSLFNVSEREILDAVNKEDVKTIIKLIGSDISVSDKKAIENMVDAGRKPVDAIFCQFKDVNDGFAKQEYRKAFKNLEILV